MQTDTQVNRAVVIGTSLGGVNALRELLGHLPSDLPAAIFITMHSGGHPSRLPSLLAAVTSLPVSFATDEQQIQQGHVYIAPPDQHLLVGRHTMRLSWGAKENHTRPAIDPMFRSAAISFRNLAIGVILTGELDDGVVGLQAVKAYGGAALVQDPETAESPSMPTHALRHVDVDACLPLPQLAEALVQCVTQPPKDDPTNVPRRIEPFATEDELARDLSDGGVPALESIGKAAGISCPECGGGLWDLGGSPARFRCHTGHSYTAAALLDAGDGSIEEALWVAIRALHEKQLILGRLAQSRQNAGRSGAVAEYERTSAGLEIHKTALKSLLTSLRSLEAEIAPGGVTGS